MEHCLEMILANLSGLLPCRFMQLLLHSCFNSSVCRKVTASLCLPLQLAVSGSVRIQRMTGASALTALIQYYFGFVQISHTGCIAVRAVTEWWAGDGEGWESRHFLKWEDDPHEKISPLLKRKAQPSCKSCRSEGEKSLPAQNLVCGESLRGMDVLCATSLVPAAPLHSMKDPHWSFRARQDKILRYSLGSCFLYTKKAK